MFRLAVVVALLCALAVVATASDVEVWTDANFDEQVAKGPAMLEAYAPWCGFCKRLTPTWEEAATQAKTEEKEWRVAKIDCTVETHACARLKVKGYPSIFFLKEGTAYIFNRGRELESVIRFADEYHTFPSTESFAIPSAEDVPKPPPKAKKVKTAPAKQEAPAQDPNSDVVVLGDANFDDKIKEGGWFVKFYAPWCGWCKKIAPVWDELATALKGKVNVAKVDCTVENAVKGRFSIRGFPTLKFIKDGKVYDYSGARDLETLTAFAEGGYESASVSDVPSA